MNNLAQTGKDYITAKYKSQLLLLTKGVDKKWVYCSKKFGNLKAVFKQSFSFSC